MERKKSLVGVGVALQTFYFEREVRGQSSDQREIGTRSGRSVVLHLGGEVFARVVLRREQHLPEGGEGFGRQFLQ